MIFTDSKLEGIEKSLEVLESALNHLGFVTHNWDYDKATFDLKMEDPATNQVYYLRLLGHLVSGKMQNPNAVLKLKVPVVGRHLFPHGIDYSSEVPAAIAEKAKHVVEELESSLGV